MSSLNPEELIGRIQNIYYSCDPSEQAVLIQILEELAETGESKTYEQVWLADYKEVPVDIDTFLNSDTYLGKTNSNGASVYPFWRKELHNVFDAGNKYYEWILSGATRIGKTSTAVSGSSYDLYRLMCLRDPQKFFGTKEVSKFSILFFNITKDLAKGVAFREFNDTLKASPWFNAHGTFTKSESNYIYIPEGGKIVIDFGSDASHGLGMQVYCMVGTTKILTSAGYKTLAELKGKSAEIAQYAPDGSIEYSRAKVKLTKITYRTVTIYLEDDSIFEGSYEHMLMMSDGKYKEMQYITANDELMGVKTKPVKVVKTKITLHTKYPVELYDVIDIKPHHNFVIHDKHDFVSHNCAVMDECNFSQAGVKDVKKAKEKMRNTYTTIAARVSGTFKHGGKVFGRIYACSSKRSDSDFMEDYVAEQLDAGAGDHMYISDAPQWEVKPPETFSKETFTIAVGGRHQKSFVVPDNQCFPEALADLESQGYRLLHPPVDMKSNFLADFNIALRDLAGIAVLGSASYFTQEMLTKCINTSRRNPFYSDILQTGVKDNIAIEDYFHINEVPIELKRAPIYIHLDLSLVTDRTGISGGAITGRKDITSADGKTTSLPTFTQMFALAVEAPRDDKISYSKVVAFICWLRKSGFNIAGISRDQFQSEYLAQELERQGFTVDKISLDRTPDGYVALHTAILEERIDLLDSKLLQDELIHLQRDLVTGRLDHPIGGCFTADTKVALVDGRQLPISELLLEQEYRQNWVYTMNEITHKIEPKPIKKVFQTKLTKQLVKVTLDNGEVITCTPEHKFMLRNGEYREIQHCNVGESLMPLYTKYPVNTFMKYYRMYYEPFEQKWHFEHRQFCKNVVHKKGYLVHHQNYHKYDNCPTNLLCVTTADHRRIHNNRSKDYVQLSKTITQWHKKMKGTDAYLRRSEACRKGTMDYYKSVIPNYKPLADQQQERIAEIERIFDVKWSELSISERDSYGVKYSRMLDPTIQERISVKLSEAHKAGKFHKIQEVISQKRWVTNGVDNLYINKDENIPEGYHLGRVVSWSSGAKSKAYMQSLSPEERSKIYGSAKGKIWINNGEKNKYIPKDSPIPDGWVKGRLTPWQNKSEYKNHKIVSIEFITKPCRVYDLEIKDNHNFALGAGVFVHNSKDLSDATAGWVWNAIQKNPPIPISAKARAAAIALVNGNRSNDPKQNPIMERFGSYKKY